MRSAWDGLYLRAPYTRMWYGRPASIVLFAVYCVTDALAPSGVVLDVAVAQHDVGDRRRPGRSRRYPRRRPRGCMSTSTAAPPAGR